MSETVSFTSVTPNRSEIDKRDYAYLILENGLEVLVVHDPEADKASASLDVKVGHLSDPDLLPGLAHFCEHMLFMGTKKFPKEDEFSEYIRQNGGHSNAYTATEDTNYHFECKWDTLEGALDRFAQFFIAPLFDASATDREMKAVDSEFKNGKSNDGWREYQLVKSKSRSDHPYSKFGTGNLETLSETPGKQDVNVRDALLKFHEDYYSSNVMKLAIVGRHSLDQLRSWALKYFSDIPNFDKTPPSFDDDPYGSKQLARITRMVPVKPDRTIKIAWPLPAMEKHWKSKPHSFLSHFLGHEGAGSILYSLKQRGLGSELYSGYQDSSFFCLFYVKVTLTEKGLQQWEEVVTTIFEYIALLLAASDEQFKTFFDEVQAVAALDFRFKSRESPLRYASSLSATMHKYPPENVLDGGYLYRKFDPKLLRATLARMNVENSMVLLAGQELAGECKSEERWYGTQFDDALYSKEQVATWRKALKGGEKQQDKDTKGDESKKSGEKEKDWLAAFQRKCEGGAELFLPCLNPFIATDFTVYGTSEESAHQSQVNRKAGLTADNSRFSTDSEAKDTDGESDDNEKSGWRDPPVKLVTDQVDTAVLAPFAGLLDAAPSDGQKGGDQKSSDEQSPRPGKLSLWFKQDRKFCTPKLDVRIKLQSPLMDVTPRQRTLSSLYLNLAKESLNSLAYYAECASLSYGIEALDGGICISLRGYSHKMPGLARALLSKVRNLKVSEEEFELIKGKLSKNLRVQATYPPYAHSSFTFSYFLQGGRDTPARMLRELQGIQLSDLQLFQQAVYAQMGVTVMLFGNVTETQAFQYQQLIERELRFSVLSTEGRNRRRVVRIRDAHDVIVHAKTINPLEENSCAYVRFQLDRATPQLRAATSLLSSLLHPAAFNQLRTKETLGYIVYARRTTVRGVLYVDVVVQGPGRTAKYLDSRVEACLDLFRKEKLGGDDFDTVFETQRASLLNEFTSKFKTAHSEANSHWLEISTGRNNFYRNWEIAEAVRQLKAEDVLAVFDDYLAVDGSHRAKISIHRQPPVIPEAKKSEEGEGNDQEGQKDEGSEESLHPAPKSTNTRLEYTEDQFVELSDQHGHFPRDYLF